MDFSYSDDQQALIELAKQILRDKATHPRMKQLEKSGGPRFDRELWAELAKAGLLGVAIPSEYGGAGLGFLEVAGIAEQIGRTTAPIPFLETVVLAAMPIAKFGTEAQKKALLPQIVRGEIVVTAALTEPVADYDHPQTRVRRAGEGWRLDGVKLCVPAGQIADRILVPADCGDGKVGVFLLDSGAPGVRLTALQTTSGQPEAHLELQDVRVDDRDLVGSIETGAAMVGWMAEHFTAALCSLAIGVCDEALQMTAEYLKTRKQFDQPIGMFQAAGHRAANAYVDTEGVRLTAMQAAWRLAAGLPAAKQVHIAKCWAADGGQRVVHAAQHLHGGIGVDRDYPLHRYFLYARQLELTLGGAPYHYRALGKLLADEYDS